MDLADVHLTFYPRAEYTFFSSAQGTFSRTDDRFGCKTSLSKFKETEIIPSIFSYHSGMKLENSNKRKSGKFMNTWKLNNTVLNNQWSKKKLNGK